jgi:uncharacterized protein YdhG (YjbR/CyaY superfamily)
MGNQVDDYLARLPIEKRNALQSLRTTITSVVPYVEETISSGVPAFRYNKRPLVSMGASKRHLSLFIMYGESLRKYRDALSAYDTSNTVIRFPPDKPLPAGLVRKLVKARLTEIE